MLVQKQPHRPQTPANGRPRRSRSAVRRPPRSKRGLHRRFQRSLHQRHSLLKIRCILGGKHRLRNDKWSETVPWRDAAPMARDYNHDSTVSGSWHGSTYARDRAEPTFEWGKSERAYECGGANAVLSAADRSHSSADAASSHCSYNATEVTSWPTHSTEVASWRTPHSEQAPAAPASIKLVTNSVFLDVTHRPAPPPPPPPPQRPCTREPALACSPPPTNRYPSARV